MRVHLTPHFGDRPIGDIDRRDVEGLMAASRAAGRTVKTTLNHLGVLHSIFEYALREEWVRENPCRLAAKRASN